MKKTLLLFAVIFSISLANAQAPQGINYQGVARDPSGNAISKLTIGLQFQIHAGSSGGPVVYSETHSVQTDTFGLYTAIIGSTSGSGTGTFSSVNWSAGVFYIEVDIDPAGGSSYTPIATSQLMSVPYALYAGSAGNSSNGTVTSVTTNTPLSVTNPTTAPVISITAANGSTDGYLTMGDWTVFNNKGNGTVTSITGGTGIDGGTIVNSGTFSLSPSGVSPGSYGNVTSYPTFTVDAMGRITNAAVQTFTTSGGTVTSVSVAANTPITVANPNTTPTLSMSPANGTTDGFLSQTDWNTFNNKGNGTVTSITTGTGLIPAGTFTNTANISVDTVSALYNAIKLQGSQISITTPTVGNVLQYNSSNQWAPANIQSLPAPSPGSMLFSDPGTNTWKTTNPAQMYSDGNSITVVNTTTVGTAGTFITNNAGASNAAALQATSNSSTGYAIRADNNSGAAILANSGGPYAINGNLSAGGGNAVEGDLLNSATGGNAIAGLIDGTSSGSAGYFQNTNPGNTVTTLSVSTNASGAYSGQFSGGKGVQIDNLQVQTNLNIPLNANPGFVLTSNAAGDATWQPSGSAGVNSVAVNPPLTQSGTVASPTISINQASNTTAGYLTPVDWNTFNNKISNVTASGSALTSTTIANSTTITANNSNALWNANQLEGFSISTATPTVGQVLTYTAGNWTPTTFTAGTVTSFSTAAGQLTGGPITNTGTIGLATVPTVTAGGYGSATAIPTFTVDAFGRVTSAGTTTFTAGSVTSVTVAAGTPASVMTITNANTTPTLSMTAATAGNDGYLTKGDWSTFNGKISSVGTTTATALTVTTATTNAVTITANNSSALWNANQLQGQIISATAPAFGQVLQFNGASWVPTNTNAGTVTSVIAGAGLTGTPSNTITTSGTISMPNIGTAGTYGSSTLIPSITTDAQGRVTTVTTNSIGGTLSGGTTNYMPKWTSATALSSTSLIFDNGTNVGIGTTTPGAKLDVAQSSTVAALQATNSGTAGNAGNFSISGASNSFQTIFATTSGTGKAGDFQINNTSNSSTAFNAFTNGTGSAGNFQIANAANSNPALNVTTNGNAGPAGNFVITNTVSTAAALTANTAGTGPAIYSNGPLKLGGPVVDVLNVAGSSGDVLVSQGPGSAPKWQSPTAVGSWALSGNAASAGEFIGTTNAQPFTIATTNTATAQPIVFKTRALERMRIDTSGNVGIGNSFPTSLLSVGSTSQFQVNSSGTIAAATGITSSGAIKFSGLATNGIVRTTGGSGTLSSGGGIDLTTEVIGILPVANGGTGSSSQNFVDLSTVQTVGGNKTWSGAAAFSSSVTITGPATFNMGLSSTGAAVNLNASSNFPTNINTGTSTGTVTIGNASNNVNLPKLTASAIVLTDASKNLTSTALGNGQLLIGSAGVAPVAANLMAGMGISISNGAGNITISTTGPPPLTGSGSTNYMTKWTSPTSLGNSLLYENGTNVGIGTTTAGSKLEVTGDVAIPGANEFKYTSAKTHYLAIPAAGFVPLQPQSYSLDIFNLVYFYIPAGGGAGGAINSVNLPDGAVITNLTVYLYDNDPFNGISVDFIEVTNTTGSRVQAMPNVGTSGPGTSASIQAPSIGGSYTIDNLNKNYYLQVNTQQGNSNLRFHSAKITYTVNKAD